MTTSVLDIQKALVKAGFDPGPLDGIRGRRTIRAIKTFQMANGLLVDGIVGPKTSAVLLGVDAMPVAGEAIPWMDEALGLAGTREQPGRGSNPVILDWATGLGLDYDDEDVPWCGLFVGHCIGSQLPDEPLPKNVLGARSWTSFGREVSPRRGAVMVFWRGKRNGWRGHVGFYAAEDRSAFHILGGNQSNAVNIARISKQRLLGAYWPVTAGCLTAAREFATSDGGKLSENEE